MQSAVPRELQASAPVNAGICQARKQLCPEGSWGPGGQDDRESAIHPVSKKNKKPTVSWNAV